MEQERRSTHKDMLYFWEKLNQAQKFAVAELQRFGYELLFVRQQGDTKLALLAAGHSLASVNNEGQIDTAPRVVLRH